MNDIIFTYTRQEAIDDGVLVDVTHCQAYKDLPFSVPVALTQAIYQDCVAWNNDTESVHQNEDARLYDVLWMAIVGIQMSKGHSDQIMYRMFRVKRGESEASEVRLKVVIGPDDDGRPCLTIMLPHED